jgi:FolB domain-containing protein
MDYIHIHDLRLQCIIGVYEAERREKQDVVIRISLGTDLKPAGESDDLSCTIDYKKLKQEIKILVEKSQYLLIERLAETIAAHCLCLAAVQNVKVTVEKPGALRFVRTVGVEINRSRS